MDQAELADQALFRHDRQCGQDPSLDCHLVCVLVAIVRKELRPELSLSQILQILSVNVFEQVPLAELVAKTQSQKDVIDSHNQLMLWE